VAPGDQEGQQFAPEVLERDDRRVPKKKTTKKRKRR
jgi:hypothetical protein